MKKLIRIFFFFVITSILVSCSSTNVPGSTTKFAESSPENKNNQQNFDYENYIGDYLWTKVKGELGNDFELLGFKIENYEEDFENGIYDAVFNFKIFYRNLEKNPDLIPYIKEAKEKESSNYKILYNEYLEKKELDLKIRAIRYEDGETVIYENSSKKGDVVWEELEIPELILSYDKNF